MTDAMRFEWDEAKRHVIMAERGVDLLKAARIFEGDVLQRLDDRHDHGEPRYLATGMVEDTCFVIVWTPRGDICRLITAWKGGRDERAALEDRHA